MRRRTDKYASVLIAIAACAGVLLTCLGFACRPALLSDFAPGACLCEIVCVGECLKEVANMLGWTTNDGTCSLPALLAVPATLLTSTSNHVCNLPPFPRQCTHYRVCRMTIKAHVLLTVCYHLCMRDDFALSPTRADSPDGGGETPCQLVIASCVSETVRTSEGKHTVYCLRAVMIGARGTDRKSWEVRRRYSDTHTHTHTHTHTGSPLPLDSHARTHAQTHTGAPPVQRVPRPPHSHESARSRALGSALEKSAGDDGGNGARKD